MDELRSNNHSLRTSPVPGSLTLALIAKNEERHIGECIESVRGVASEVVLIDTGSEDRTAEIARSKGARVFNFPWCDDFSAARNQYLLHATSEWILCLDADERIRPEQHDLLRQMLRDPAPGAYVIKLRNAMAHDGANKEIVSDVVRLYKNLPGIRYEGRIHEQITEALRKAGAIFKPSELIIDHLGYGSSQELVQQKARRNLELLHKQIQEEPGNAYAFYQIGQTYLVLKQSEKGIEYLMKALEIPGLIAPIRASIYNFLAEQAVTAGRLDEGELWCAQSLRFSSQQIQARMLLSTIAYRKRDFVKAADYLTQVLDFILLPEEQRRPDIAADAAFEPYVIRHRLGHCLRLTGKLEEARACFSAVLAEHPEIVDTHAEVALITAASGDAPKALETLAALRQQHPQHRQLAIALAEAHQLNGDKAEAARVLHAALTERPQ